MLCVRYWHGDLSGARCKWFACGPADATATSSSLAPVKSRMVCLSGAGLPRLSWKRPLNGCSSSNMLCVRWWPAFLCYCSISAWQSHICCVYTTNMNNVQDVYGNSFLVNRMQSLLTFVFKIGRYFVELSSLKCNLPPLVVVQLVRQ